MIKSQIDSQNEEGLCALPNEVLINIAELINDRENLSMSCKKFYLIVCELEKNLKEIKLNVEKVQKTQNIKIQILILKFS